MRFYTLPAGFEYLIHDYVLIAIPILYLIWVLASRSSQMKAAEQKIPPTQYPKIISILYNATQVRLRCSESFLISEVALSCYMAYGIFGPGGFNFRYFPSFRLRVVANH
jgi:hypothetical protein